MDGRKITQFMINSSDTFSYIIIKIDHHKLIN